MVVIRGKVDKESSSLFFSKSFGVELSTQLGLKNKHMTPHPHAFFKGLDLAVFDIFFKKKLPFKKTIDVFLICFLNNFLIYI